MSTSSKQLDKQKSLQAVEDMLLTINQFRVSITRMFEDLESASGTTSSECADALEENTRFVYDNLNKLTSLSDENADIFAYAHAHPKVKPFQRRIEERDRSREDTLAHYNSTLQKWENQTPSQPVRSTRIRSSFMDILEEENVLRKRAKHETEGDISADGQIDIIHHLTSLWESRVNTGTVKSRIQVDSSNTTSGITLHVHRIFKAKISFRFDTTDAIEITRVAVFATNENKNGTLDSDHLVFRKISQLAVGASKHFYEDMEKDQGSIENRRTGDIDHATAQNRTRITQTGLWKLLIWLESYYDLYSAPCLGCNRLLKFDSPTYKLLVPCLRAYKGSQRGGAWHVGCIP